MRLTAILILGLLIAGPALGKSERLDFSNCKEAYAYILETKPWTERYQEPDYVKGKRVTGGHVFFADQGLVNWSINLDGGITFKGSQHPKNGDVICQYRTEPMGLEPWKPKSYPDIIIEDGDGNVIGKGYYSR